MWKQLFDAVEQRVGPSVNEFAKSDNAVTVAALAQRGRRELERRLERSSRRTLHLFNMPAGSDVNRLLEHITRLEREVRELRNDLADRENAEYLASLASRGTATPAKLRATGSSANTTRKRATARPKGGLHADGSNTGGTARASSA